MQLEAVSIANSANVPVILTLGTKFLIEEDPSGGKISSKIMSLFSQ